MNTLVVSLHTLLTSITQYKFRLEQPNKDTAFPYVVYNLPSSSLSEKDREDFILEIDIYDDDSDTTVLETITEEIESSLSGLRNLDEQFLFIFSKIGSFMLPDSNPSIRRRQLRYEIKTYKR